MAIYKRGRVYWYSFWFNGERVQRSTKQGNPRVARQIEAACKTALAKGEVGIIERKPAPTLKDFSRRFMDYIQVRCAEKPATVGFYAEKLTRVLEYQPMAETRLDRIDEGLIESYVQHRRKAVSPASVNRELATLRRALRMAEEWRVIGRVPRIRMLPGERVRSFVLKPEQERLYLEMAPQPLRDLAVLILDTGLRRGEGSIAPMVRHPPCARQRRSLWLPAGPRWQVPECQA
jgi:integrase